MRALASSQLVAFPSPGKALRAALMPALKQHRLPEPLSESLVREALLRPPCGMNQALAQVLGARMRLEPLDFARTPHLFLIGPPGAGVESTAARLRHHAASLGTHVTIEKATFNPLNCRARSAFACVSQRPGIATIGVVSALADAEEVSDLIVQFRIRRVIVTSLDMTRRFGTVTAALAQGALQAGVTRSATANAPLELLRPEDLARMLLR